MAKLKVMCARSMHVAVGALAKAFAEGAGHEVAFDFGTVGILQGKLHGGETALWMRRWRWFLLATAGLFGYAGGSEWGVSHYRLKAAG